MSAPLLPAAVPPLADRLLALLRTVAPGRRATIGTLTGWLSVPEDSADVQAALLIMLAQRLATVEIEQVKGHRPVRWWGP